MTSCIYFNTLHRLSYCLHNQENKYVLYLLHLNESSLVTVGETLQYENVRRMFECGLSNSQLLQNMYYSKRCTSRSNSKTCYGIICRYLYTCLDCCHIAFMWIYSLEISDLLPENIWAIWCANITVMHLPWPKSQETRKELFFLLVACPSKWIKESRKYIICQ